MTDNYILYDPAEFDKIEVKAADPNPLITRLEVIAKRYALDEVKEAAARIAAIEAAVKPLMEIYDYDVDPDRLMEWCDNIRAALGEKECLTKTF